ncbi:MAG: hypothetical protein ACRCWI_02140 [Brevinema sp.]
MPEQKQTLSFLTIKKEHFDDRHFTFKVIRPSNSLITLAKVTIKRTIYKTKKTDAKEGDRLFISIQNNSEDKILIFKGIIRSVSDMGDQIHITAESRVVANEDFNETYKDSSLEKVIKVLVQKMIYEAVDKIYSQLICRGKKEDSLRRLLRDKHYFTNLDNYLIVRDDLKGGVTFVIDNCTYHDSVKSDSIPIVPIPQLEINDIVKYMEKQFIVRAITYDYLSKAQMVLHVVKYIKETIIPSSEQKEEHPISKDAPKEYLYFENPEKLLELSEGARNHIISVTKKTYEKLGEYFEKIYITSAYRTRTEQVNILKGKLDLGTDMYDYYKSASLSAPYLKIMQYLYDGIYTEVPEEDYLAIEQAYQNRPDLEIDGKKRQEDFEKIINGNPIRKGNKEDGVQVLNLSMVQQKLFTPSFHMGCDDVNRKYSSSIDLRYSDTTDTVRNEHIDSGNKGQSYRITPEEAKQGKGDAHIHITYKASS